MGVKTTITILPPLRGKAGMGVKTTITFLPPRRGKAGMGAKTTITFLPPRRGKAGMGVKTTITFLPPSRGKAGMGVKTTTTSTGTPYSKKSTPPQGHPILTILHILSVPVRKPQAKNLVRLPAAQIPVVHDYRRTAPARCAGAAALAGLRPRSYKLYPYP